MEAKVPMRGRMAVGLMVLMYVAIGLVATASATAAQTEHWASAPLVPYGTQQELVGEVQSNVKLSWTNAGLYRTIECTETDSNAGKVENPIGGGAGTLYAAHLTFGNCYVQGNPGCEVVGEAGVHTVSFAPLSNLVEVSEAFSIQTTGANAYLTLKGAVCGVAGTYKMGGPIAAKPSGTPGAYLINEAPATSNLIINGVRAALTAQFSLKTPAGKPLVPGSTGIPKVPQWFLGTSNWVNLAEGLSVDYKSKVATPIKLSTTIGGAPFELVCSGAGTGISGSVEDPLGGGAASTNARLSLINCVVAGPTSAGCVVPKSIVSTPLSGAAKEAGVTTVEYAPTEGSKWFSVSMTQDESSSKTCTLVGGAATVKGGTLQAISKGNGKFELVGVGQKWTANNLHTSGTLVLESEAEEALRLQP